MSLVNIVNIFFLFQKHFSVEMLSNAYSTMAEKMVMTHGLMVQEVTE